MRSPARRTGSILPGLILAAVLGTLVVLAAGRFGASVFVPLPAQATAATDADAPAAGQPVQNPAAKPPSDDEQIESLGLEAPREARLGSLVASLSIFTLAIFVGWEIITKVPPTLHTPLMSGSNAISGITVVGAIVLAVVVGHRTVLYNGEHVGWINHLIAIVAMVAVALASVNVVGGFLVTHRMLSMFKRR